MGKLDDNDDDKTFFNKSKSDIENHEIAKSKVNFFLNKFVQY